MTGVQTCALPIFRFIHFDENKVLFPGSIDDYIIDLNQYIQVFLKWKNFGETEIARINVINSLYKKGYKTYIPNHNKPLISIQMLNDILSKQDIYEKFLDFNQHKDFFRYHRSTYIKELQAYIKVLEQNGLYIDLEAQSRYQFILNQNSNKSTIDISLKKEILKSIPPHFNGVSLAYAIYYNLNEHVFYDDTFIMTPDNDPKKEDIYRENIIISENKNSITCKSWSEVYSGLLEEKGFKSQICTQGKHQYVVFEYQNMVFTADATNLKTDANGVRMNDITRSHLKLDAVGFSSTDSNYKPIIASIHQELVAYKREKQTQLNHLIDQYQSISNTTYLEQQMENILAYINQVSLRYLLGPLDLASFSIGFLKANLSAKQLNEWKISTGRLIVGNQTQFVTLIQNKINKKCFLLKSKSIVQKIEYDQLLQLYQSKQFIPLNELNEKGLENDRTANRKK